LNDCITSIFWNNYSIGNILFSHGELQMKKANWLAGVLLLAGCSYTPEGARPVENFQLERYLGTWYEIARLDHSFERGLSRVSARYSKRDDGGINVINRGYDSRKERWKEAKGRAYFVGEPTVAQLKVTFFWPFYGGYNVLELDPEYRYALVSGPNRSYLWILSRTRQLDRQVLDELIAKAEQLGFATEELIRVEQE
jgi:apolipoprotein D and lipocalin family protein